MIESMPLLHLMPGEYLMTARVATKGLMHDMSTDGVATLAVVRIIHTL